MINQTCSATFKTGIFRIFDSWKKKECMIFQICKYIFLLGKFWQIYKFFILNSQYCQNTFYTWGMTGTKCKINPCLNPLALFSPRTSHKNWFDIGTALCPVTYCPNTNFLQSHSVKPCCPDTHWSADKSYGRQIVPTAFLLWLASDKPYGDKLYGVPWLGVNKSYGLISLGQTVRRQIVRTALIRGGQIVRIN